MFREVQGKGKSVPSTAGLQTALPESQTAQGPLATLIYWLLLALDALGRKRAVSRAGAALSPEEPGQLLGEGTSGHTAGSRMQTAVVHRARPCACPLPHLRSFWNNLFI